jgi:hypothetical protein
MALTNALAYRVALSQKFYRSDLFKIEIAFCRADARKLFLLSVNFSAVQGITMHRLMNSHHLPASKANVMFIPKHYDDYYYCKVLHSGNQPI